MKINSLDYIDIYCVIEQTLNCREDNVDIIYIRFDDKIKDIVCDT